MERRRGGRQVTTTGTARSSRVPQVAGSSGDEEAPVDGQHGGNMNEGFRILSMMVAGCLVYGFLGWLGDRWLGTVLLLPLGIVAGLGLAVYMVAKRYGATGTTPPWFGRDRNR